MKRLSIILSAVLMTIFFTACSSGTPVEISENTVVCFKSDPYNSLPTEVFQFESSAKGTTIKVVSDEGSQKFFLTEQYDFSLYESEKMYEAKSVATPMEPGKGYSRTYQDKYTRHIDGYTQEDCVIVLRRANGKLLIFTDSEALFRNGIESIEEKVTTTVDGTEIPILMITSKPEMNVGDIVYAPIYSTLNAPQEQNTDNIEEVLQIEHTLYRF